MAKVLLVEDDNNLREIYQARLMAEGYEISTAQNGEEALSVAKQQHPDLIISDVMMPRISGFEMLDIIRNTEELKNVKVIMLTALGQAEDRTRASGLGADKYLVKSQVTLEDIVNCAHDLLGQGNKTAAPVTPEPTQVAQPAADSTPPSVPAASGADTSPEKAPEPPTAAADSDPAKPTETSEPEEQPSDQPTAARDQKILAHDAPAFTIPARPQVQSDADASASGQQSESAGTNNTPDLSSQVAASPTVTQVTAPDPSNPITTVMPNGNATSVSDTPASTSFQAEESAIQSQIDSFSKQSELQPMQSGAAPAATITSSVAPPEPVADPMAPPQTTPDAVDTPQQAYIAVQPEPGTPPADNAPGQVLPDAAPPATPEGLPTDTEVAPAAPSVVASGSEQLITPTIISPTAAPGSYGQSLTDDTADSERPRTASIERPDDSMHAVVSGKKIIQPPTPEDKTAATASADLVSQDNAQTAGQPTEDLPSGGPTPSPSSAAKPGFDPNSISL